MTARSDAVPTTSHRAAVDVTGLVVVRVCTATPILSGRLANPGSAIRAPGVRGRLSFETVPTPIETKSSARSRSPLLPSGCVTREKPIGVAPLAAFRVQRSQRGARPRPRTTWPNR